jgi:lipopolysaccharide biosynthesis regulator YciM
VRKLLGVLIQRGRGDGCRSLKSRDLHEMTLELAVFIRLVDLGAEDEGGSRRKNHVVEVRRALDREIAKSPYLACQLSTFDDRQLVTGLPRTMFGEL